MHKRTWFTYRKDLTARARKLRNNATKSEKELWKYLKGDKLEVDFHRQRPIDNFILDFYCHEIRLGIELDGEIHDRPDRKEYDEWRENKLAQLGITILRFKNEEIENNIENTIKRIQKYMDEFYRK